MQDVAAEENHATACNYIRQSAAQGAELAVLPEYETPLFFHGVATRRKRNGPLNL